MVINRPTVWNENIVNYFFIFFSETFYLSVLGHFPKMYWVFLFFGSKNKNYDLYLMCLELRNESHFYHSHKKYIAFFL